MSATGRGKRRIPITVKRYPTPSSRCEEEATGPFSSSRRESGPSEQEGRLGGH